MVKCRLTQNNDSRKSHFSFAVMFSIPDELLTERLLATLEKRQNNTAKNFVMHYALQNLFNEKRALAFQHLAFSSILYVTNRICLALLFSS